VLGGGVVADAGTAIVVVVVVVVVVVFDGVEEVIIGGVVVPTVNVVVVFVITESLESSTVTTGSLRLTSIISVSGTRVGGSVTSMESSIILMLSLKLQSGISDVVAVGEWTVVSVLVSIGISSVVVVSLTVLTRLR